MDYRDAGVDISAADEAKARIKGLARGTFNRGVLSEIGSFGGMFLPDLSRYREPVLVSSDELDQVFESFAAWSTERQSAWSRG